MSNLLTHAPRQYDDEKLMFDNKANGDIESLVPLLRIAHPKITPSAISQQINPYVPEVKSWWHKGKVMLWAFIGVNLPLGKLMKSDLDRSFALWTSDIRVKAVSNLDTATQIAHLGVKLQTAQAKGDTEEAMSIAIKIRTLSDCFITSTDNKPLRMEVAS